MAVGAAIAAVVVTAASAYQQNRQAKAAAKDRKEAAQVSQAEQAAQQNQSRRAQIREERVRRAQVLQSSQNTGVSQSSGELGATSALGTLIGGNLAGMQRQQNSAGAIGGLTQSAADADMKGATWGAIGQVSGSIFGAAIGQIGSGSPNINPPVGQSSSPATAPQTRSQSIFG
jgi:hypothetical protein